MNSLILICLSVFIGSTFVSCDSDDIIYVQHSNEAEDSACGSKQKQCHSLYTALGRISDEDFSVLITSERIGGGSKVIYLDKTHEVTLKPESTSGLSTVEVVNTLDDSDKAYALFSFYNGGDETSFIVERIIFEILDDDMMQSGIFSVSHGLLTLDQCQFVRPNSAKEPLPRSPIQLPKRDGSMVINNCTFKGIKMNHNSNSGAVIYSSISESSSVIIKGKTTFDGCECVYSNGGAIYMTVTGHLEIGANSGDEIIFKNCKVNSTKGSGKKGGALYILVFGNDFKLNYLTFGSEGDTKDVNEADLGSNMFMEANSLSEYLNDNNIYVVYNYGSINKERFQGCDREGSEKGEVKILYDIISSSLDNTFVSSLGNDTTCDGSSTKPCKSIYKAYNFLSSRSESPSINISSNSNNLGAETKQILFTKSVSVYGKEEKTNLNVSDVKVNDESVPLFQMKNDVFVLFYSFIFDLLDKDITKDAVFSIYSGELIIHSCSFIRSSHTTGLISSPLTIHSGSVIVNGTNFNNLNMTYLDYAGGAIYAHIRSDSMLQIVGVCNFFECGSAKGPGGGIYAIIDVGGEMRIGENNNDKIYFGSCKVTTTDKAGRGGAIYAIIDDDASEDILLSNIYFGQNEDKDNIPNEAYQGPDLFVESESLSDIIYSETFPVLYLYSSDEEKKRLVGLDSDNIDSDTPLILLDLIKPGLPDGIYVKNGETGDCSVNNYCGSLSDALKLVNEDRYYILIENDSNKNSSSLSSLTSQISLTHSLIIKNINSNAKLSTKVLVSVTLPVVALSNNSSSPLFLLNKEMGDDVLEIQVFNFIISDNNQPKASIFVMNGGCLALYDCSFTREGGSSSRNNNNNNNANSLMNANPSDLSSSIISITNGICNIYTCTFRDLTMIKEGNSKEGGVALCGIFENGGAYLIGCSFDNCICKNGNGGALYFDCKVNSQKGERENGLYNNNNNNNNKANQEVVSTYYVSIESSSFTKCKCENGNGGALYSNIATGATLKIGEKEGDTTSFDGCQVTKSDDSTGRGGALYINIPSNHGVILVNDVTFKNSKGKEGKDMFVTAENISDASNKSFFPFLDDTDRYDSCEAADKDGNVVNIGKEPSKSNNNKTTIIIVIVVVVVVVVIAIIIIIVVVCLVLKRKKGGKDFGKYENKEELKNEETAEPPENEEDQDNKEERSF